MGAFILAIIAICAGFLGALLGLGGGVILVPGALFISSATDWISPLTPQSAVGLSVMMMIFTGLASTISYMKSGFVDYKAGLLFFAGAAPGAIVGAMLNGRFDVDSFNLFFGVLLIVLATIMLIRDYMKPIDFFVKRAKTRTFTDKQGATYTYGYPVSIALVLSFVVGTLSGMFGIGGGALLVPAMLVLFHFPPHIAVATSMLLVFLSSLVNASSHMALGNIPWAVVLPVVIGGYIGGKLGAATSKKLQSKTLVVILRIVLLIMGIRSVMIGLIG